MKNYTTLLCLILVLLLQGSCGIQKRKHLPGFHFSRSTKKTQTAASVRSKNKEENEVELSITPETTSKDVATKENNLEAMDLESKELPAFDWNLSKPANVSDSCDEIILKSGEIISGKVIEISETEIRYKSCDYLTGPTIVKKVKDVLVLHFSNGKQQIMKEPTPELQVAQKPDPNFNTDENFYRTYAKKMAIPGFIFGALSIALFVVTLFIDVVFIGCIAASIFGIVFSSIALSRIMRIDTSEMDDQMKRSLHNDKGLAIAGLAMSIASFVAVAIFLFIMEL